MSRFIGELVVLHRSIESCCMMSAAACDEANGGWPKCNDDDGWCVNFSQAEWFNCAHKLIADKTHQPEFGQFLSAYIRVLQSPKNKKRVYDDSWEEKRFDIASIKRRLTLRNCFFFSLFTNLQAEQAVEKRQQNFGNFKSALNWRKVHFVVISLTANSFFFRLELRDYYEISSSFSPLDNVKILSNQLLLTSRSDRGCASSRAPETEFSGEFNSSTPRALWRVSPSSSMQKTMR